MELFFIFFLQSGFILIYIDTLVHMIQIYQVHLRVQISIHFSHFFKSNFISAQIKTVKDLAHVLQEDSASSVFPMSLGTCIRTKDFEQGKVVAYDPKKDAYSVEILDDGSHTRVEITAARLQEQRAFGGPQGEGNEGFFGQNVKTKDSQGKVVGFRPRDAMYEVELEQGKRLWLGEGEISLV